MFTETLFMIAKSWKQPKFPSTDQWLNKMYINTTQCSISTKYYSAMKELSIDK